MPRFLMPVHCLGLICLCFVGGIATQATADGPSLLRMFGKRPSAEADASKMYELSDEDGPWMILASTLTGDGAKQRANQLALEIRSNLGLPAFIYKEKFDFTGTLRYDQITSKRVRYANRYQYEAYAVLVGEYDRVDHPDVQRDLKKIKTTSSKVLEDPNALAAEMDGKSQASTVKIVATKLRAMSMGGKRPGPMANAFATRNPMLPEDYFEAPVVDSFVSQLNEAFDAFNLLQSDGKFTVIVKTFQGSNTIANSKEEKNFTPSVKRLDKMATDAQMMVRELRKTGVEAYQFHDRSRSLVTIGSFDSLGRQLPGGGFQYDPEILRVMRQYSALNVNSRLAGQVPMGSKGVAGNHIKMIPFDVEPTPIAVPQKTKRSLYGATFGRR